MAERDGCAARERAGRARRSREIEAQAGTYDVSKGKNTISIGGPVSLLTLLYSVYLYYGVLTVRRAKTSIGVCARRNRSE